MHCFGQGMLQARAGGLTVLRRSCLWPCSLGLAPALMLLCAGPSADTLYPTVRQPQAADIEEQSHRQEGPAHPPVRPQWTECGGRQNTCLALDC